MILKLIRFFKEIYQEKPKEIKKKGHPKKYSDFQIVLICFVMSFKRIYSFSGIINYLHANKALCKLIGLKEVPSRTTLSRRAKDINKKQREVIQSIGNYFSNLFKNIIFFSSFDSSLFASKGPLWHKKQRKKGILPCNLRGVDRDSKWGYSQTKNWVQGYKGHFNVISDMKRYFPPFPVDAVVTTANTADCKKGKTLFWYLPDNVLFQLGDKGYDDTKLFWYLYMKKKLLITPIKKAKEKNILRQFREKIYSGFKKSQLSFARNTTVEPFNGRLKDCFNLDPLPVKGKKKVQLFILSSVLVYQLIYLNNIKCHRKIGAIKENLYL